MVIVVLVIALGTYHVQVLVRHALASYADADADASSQPDLDLGSSQQQRTRFSTANICTLVAKVEHIRLTIHRH